MSWLGVLLVCATAIASGAAQAALIDDVPDPELAGEFEITVQEKKKRFNPKLIRSASGTVMFTVVVPRSAKRMHGVGIDGGVYKKNRRKGFRTKVIVEQRVNAA